MNQAVKKFQFFNQEYLSDQKKQLNDIEISDGYGIKNVLYLSSNKNCTIYMYANNQVYDQFTPYNDQLIFMKANLEYNKLVTFGVDADHHSKISIIKLWEPANSEFQNKKPKKLVQTKVQNYTCFGMTKNCSAMAFGLKDGKINYFYSKNQGNLDYKEGTLSLDTEPIRSIHLTRNEQNVIIYYTTDAAIYVVQNFQNNKRSFTYQGGPLFEITMKGSLIGCPLNDTESIIEVTDPTKRSGNSWIVEGNKLEVKQFRGQYLAIQLTQKSEKDNADQLQLVIFDYLNGYIAFYKKYENIIKVVVSNDYLYLITQTSKGDKAITKFTEKENTHKIETFFKNNYYDVMYTFAQNQNNDESVLSEICRMHGDHLYQQHDFEGAIKKYMQAGKQLQPSIVYKFLDVALIDYLISYLENIHKSSQVQSHHTALLLNCYIKVKQINKFIETIDKFGFDSQLFDIETAIKECRALGHFDIALKLAVSRKLYTSSLQIYIIDKGQCTAALEYIRDEVILDEKASVIKEFGLELIKGDSQLTLEIISQLALLINLIQNLKKQQGSRKGIENLDRLTPEQQKVFKYFHLTNEQLTNVFALTFSKPDEFLYIFTGYNFHLENYLRFLIEECVNLPNEKLIFHRYFEFHLESYERQESTEESEEKIMKLLQDEKNQSKYDQNHLLVQFKIYKFTAGIIFLLKKLQMREELLNFYITHQNNQQIITVCSEYGEKEQNLWIQALKYFAKPENHATNFIPVVLQEISKLESISPLLILDIMKENQNVQFGDIRTFLKQTLSRDLKQINENQEIVKQNIRKANEGRQEYKRLKTQAKVFQLGKCASCENPLTLPSFHFLCDHSYHENCIHFENQMRVCMRCSFETQMLLKRQSEAQEQERQFVDLKKKMLETNQKYDIIQKYK